MARLIAIDHLNWEILILTPVLLVLIVLVFMFAWQRASLRQYESEVQRLREVLTGVRTSVKLEDNLNLVLGVLEKIISAPYLAFYVLDTRSQRYLLRSVRHPYDGFQGVGPAYSGLALPNREAQLPPLVLEEDSHGTSVEHTKDGEVPILVLRTRGKGSLIRIGPIERVTSKKKSALRNFMRHIEGLVDDLVQLEIERMREEANATADSAIRRVAALAIDTHAAVEIIVRAFSGVSHGVGGIFFEDPQYTPSGNIFGVGRVTNIVSQLDAHINAFAEIHSILSGRAYALLTRNDHSFYELPESVTDSESGAVALVSAGDRGILMFLYDGGFHAQDAVERTMGQLSILHDQLSKVSVHYRAQRNLSQAYSKLLVQMIDMVDNLNPYTVGYSDMTMRYALVIGREMGLSEEEMLDLALAARLSNVGVIGLDMELLVKEGKYTNFEYETMKQHCETGASMIQVATGNQRAASYVMSHHERMDGHGYPHGLKGEEIPIGARILHVVQVFLAKVNGRAWREPLSFDKVLDELRTVAGTQLDPEVVQAFFHWLKNRQMNPEVKGKSLGRCFEMCATPQAICESCPAYQQPDVNCWEVGNHHCSSHGKECSTCFVRSEYLHRDQMTYIMEQRSWQGEYMR